MLRELQIELSTDERQAHETWFHRSRNTQQGKVNAILWLHALGLPNQTITLKEEKQARNVKVLTSAELLAAQQLLTAVSRELQADGVRAQSKLEKYRNSRAVTGLTLQEFREALKKEVPPQLAKKFNDQEGVKVMHYLVREEYSMVSFEKLYEALNLTEQDPPLRQEKADEYRRYVDKVHEGLDKAAGGVPPAIIHFNHWMTTEDKKLVNIFNL